MWINLLWNVNIIYITSIIRYLPEVYKLTLSILSVRTSHGGVQRDAVHGDDASSLQDREGAQPELCHPAVHQCLSSETWRCQPPSDHSKHNRVKKDFISQNSIFFVLAVCWGSTYSRHNLQNSGTNSPGLIWIENLVFSPSEASSVCFSLRPGFHAATLPWLLDQWKATVMFVILYLILSYTGHCALRNIF